jgi:alpha-L-arabinofuranosidase
VPALHAAATYDAEAGRVALFAVNRDRHHALDLHADLRGFGAPVQVLEHQVLRDDDLSAANTATHPDRVVPRQGTTATTVPGGLTVTLPPASWTVLALAVPGAADLPR